MPADDLGSPGFRPRSGRALIEERVLERKVREKIIADLGYHSPRIIRVEQEPDRVVALFVIETLGGEKAMTAFLDADGTEPVEGFVF